MIRSAIVSVREKMKQCGMFAYLVPTSDFHSSEYVGEHFKTRAFLSGFTGSAGTLVVTQQEAGLFVDGRYFLQAGQQLECSGIDLYKLGEPGVPTVNEFIERVMPENSVLGMDGRTVTAAIGDQLKQLLAGKNITFATERDLVDEIWTDRPPISDKKAFLLDIRYTGMSAADKLAQLRADMANMDAYAHVITTLDDIMWLFNIRGGDIEDTPAALCYAVIEAEKAYLFIDECKLTDEVKAALSGINVEFLPYNGVYAFVSRYKGKRVLLCRNKVNLALCMQLADAAEIIDRENPTVLKKAIKNPTELANLREIHIADGVAVARTMHYIKQNIGKQPLSELGVAAFIEGERAKIVDAMGPSFDTICGYGPHGAIVHYSATPKSDAVLLPESFLLLDSGGQYLRGTTDITRTIALGPLTQQQKKHFAMVLRSMLNLAAAKFLYGCSGMNLDILARAPFWDEGLDYNHGTGHGVGYLSGVHEAPNGFRWKKSPARDEEAVLQEGMVTTDEPGVYIENEYGIRLENELICIKDEENGFGQFMRFENLTFAPIDLDALDVSLLSEIERARLNDYHAQVYEKLSAYMHPDELVWLREYTRAV
ncbi:MAG: aminopeptidase P family protein [Clostridia bacterium]